MKPELVLKRFGVKVRNVEVTGCSRVNGSIRDHFKAVLELSCSMPLFISELEKNFMCLNGVFLLGDTELTLSSTQGNELEASWVTKRNSHRLEN